MVAFEAEGAGDDPHADANAVRRPNPRIATAVRAEVTPTTTVTTADRFPGDSRSLLRAAELQLRLGRPADVGRPSGPLEQADQRGRRVDLVAQRTVARRRGMRVVEVVPRLAERDDRRAARSSCCGPSCVAGCLPNMWQIEFTLHVTWCSSIMRASPAQRSAVSAPPIAPESVQPRKNGAASEKIANSGKQPADDPRVGVVEQIGRVARRRRDVALEQPADVRVRRSRGAARVRPCRAGAASADHPACR